MSILDDEQGSVNDFRDYPFYYAFDIYLNRNGQPVIERVHRGGRVTKETALAIAKLAMEYAEIAPSPQEIAHEIGEYCDEADCEKCKTARRLEKISNTFPTQGRPNRIEPGWVYLAKIGDLYKIGATKDVRTRLSQLKKEHKQPVELIGTISTTDKFRLELAWLRNYIDYHVRGEFFCLDDDAISDFLVNCDAKPGVAA